MGKCRENKKKPKLTGRLVTVARIEDLPRGRGATVHLKDKSQVALFNVKGTFYAIENFCPHKGYPLADSPVHGHKVECEHHGWRFDLRNGRCLKKRKCSVESYEVIVEHGWLKIKV